MRMIDLRSDTAAHPSAEMREAMATAEVGDDVAGEDPTANRLEEMAAEMLGKEAALFVSSGTMGNLVAALTHCRSGDEMIVGDNSHMYVAEAAGASALGGIGYHPMPTGDRGMLDHVLVIAMSEFGRTPRINGHIGRDHWPEAWTIAMAGCGLKRGVVIGKTNKTGTAVVGDEYDIGHMFHTWYKALGIDAKETEYMNGDQPLPIAHHKMHAITQALA